MYHIQVLGRLTKVSEPISSTLLKRKFAKIHLIHLPGLSVEIQFSQGKLLQHSQQHLVKLLIVQLGEKTLVEGRD